MIGNKKNLSSVQGYSLLEVLVSLTIFSLVILAAMNIFQAVINGQREAIVSRNLQESLRFTIDVMSKEIRSAKPDDSGVCNGLPGKIFSTDVSSSSLKFVNADNECVNFSVANQAVVVNRATFRATTTPDNIKVNNFKVNIIENDVSQPRVTFRIEVEASTTPGRKQKLSVQTTISSKFINFANGVATSVSLDACAGLGGFYTDTRGAETITYPVVSIGDQCWFAENLRATKYPDGTAIAVGPAGQGAAGWDVTSTAYYSCPPNVANNDKDPVCGNAVNADGKKLGLLYQWNAAMKSSSSSAPAASVATGAGPQGICPAGWQVPADDNTDGSGMGKLYSTATSLCGAGNEGTCLKTGGVTGFNGPLAGNRGYCGDGDYCDRASYVDFWSSSSWGSGGYSRSLSLGANISQCTNSGTLGLSVRCLKSKALGEACTQNYQCGSNNCGGGVCAFLASSDPCSGLTQLDYNGDTYSLVGIGSQCWFAENLRTTKKPDGTDIGALAYCYPGGCGSPWGRLYNWNTAMNGSTTATSIGAKIQGICPGGWHIPSDYSADPTDDFQKLLNYLGGASVAGGALKRTETPTYWDSPNVGATNSSGFSAVATSYVVPMASPHYGYATDNTDIWTSVESSSTEGTYNYIETYSTAVIRNVAPKTFGLSIRCIKN